MPHRNPPRLASILARVLGACALVLAWSAAASAQVSPEESARQLKPAEGLEVNLWASEPMVVNPTTIDIDSRGRVWVTEGLNYRLSRGGNKKFERIEGADKIKILEDTDGDGKADKVTVFADNVFPVPMGIAVEEFWSKAGKYQGCKVYVGNSPNLLVLEDTDGDDQADKRYSLLTGFGGIDSDHGVHGTVLGPDGKLYFTHGDGCCSVQQDHSEKTQNFDVVDKSGRHVTSDQLANTLRSNRDGTQFEIIADRQRNNYETCLNSFGNQFTSDNDDDGNRGSRVIWVMDGGKYGYRTSPMRHWAEEMPGNVPKLVGTGNGSPCGLMVYEGGLLPQDYQGAVLEAEAGPRVINYFPLTRKGAAFRTEHKIMLSSDDNWFRPVDVTAAPDGSVFVADWYDGGVGGHAFRDQTTGRIYRVAPTGAKSNQVKVDFSTIEGLMEALKSPVVATRDVARRLLAERGEEAKSLLLKRFKEGEPEQLHVPAVEGGQPSHHILGTTTGITPIQRARLLWTLSAIEGGEAASRALHDQDPRIREQAVRILGRDVSRDGKVEDPHPAPLAASKSLEQLLPLAVDPDAGVRRELILSFRDLPTSDVGPALKALAKSWDGQDRWYLEALGLALRHREPEFLKELFDGSLYGDLNLPESGKATNIALPPYFPVDRNEAFISASDPDLPPASPLSKTIGLAWQVHRAEVLPLLSSILPQLATPEWQAAADDVIKYVDNPDGAVALAELAQNLKDPIRQRQILASLGRKLSGDHTNAKNRPEVVRAIESALANPDLRAQGIQTAAATEDPRYAPVLLTVLADAKSPEDARVAAVEAVGRIKPPQGAKVLDDLIARSLEKKTSDPAAEAAVRTLPRLGNARDRLASLMTNNDAPLGLRREALRTFAQVGDGGQRLLAMVREKTLPDALKVEAATALRTHSDRRVRDEVEKLLPITSASGQPLPSIYELIRRDGKPDHGRAVFFRAGTNACGSCHRVQGQGQWVGPDLSTIGVKYGKEELLRSVLNPSAAISYNYRGLVVATTDGQIVTGLVVEETPDRLVLKTADGKRVTLRPAEIESRATSEISLMPEGLAQGLTEQDLVDLLAFLTTLKQPVSIIGRFDALTLPSVGDNPPRVDPKAKFDPTATIEDPSGAKHTWRRVDADAEGRIELAPLTGGVASGPVVHLHAPVTSPDAQPARLILDTNAEVQVWVGGVEVHLSRTGADAPRTAEVTLPRGTTDLLVRVSKNVEGAAVVTTLVTNTPLEFSPSETAKVSAR